MAGTPVRVLEGAPNAPCSSRANRRSPELPVELHNYGKQYINDHQHRVKGAQAARFCKRSLDVATASMLLLMLLPLMLIVALAIKLESAGPAIFVQRRVGMNGKTFRIYKFRSMHVLEDGQNVSSATRNDPRVTRIGRWIRRTSIDELPQLVNVIYGDMSLVGPRPHVVSQDQYYCGTVEGYSRRHSVRPGLTGWAQVRGHRGEIRTFEDIAGRVEDDVYYIDNWSILFDFKILLYTIVVIIRSADAY